MYKFVTLRDLETVDMIIGDRPTLRFSPAYMLNDPYELKFNLTIDPTSNKHEARYFKSNPEHTLEHFRSWQQQVSTQSIWFTEQQIRSVMAQMITIGSFAGTNKNNLMWSHYTNNHTGMCIEYHPAVVGFLENQKGFIGYGKVTYSDTPPMVYDFESDREKLVKIIFNKQAEWRYEQELRVVMAGTNAVKSIPIDPRYIKSVYIGARTPQDREDRIIKNCKKNGIDLWYGITMGDSYEVAFKPYKEGTTYMRSYYS
jgi:hypothetical protein